MLCPVMKYVAVGVVPVSMSSTSSWKVFADPSATKRLRRHFESMFTLS